MSPPKKKKVQEEMAEHKTLKGDRQFSTNAEKEVSQLNPILEEIIILVESA